MASHSLRSAACAALLALALAGCADGSGGPEGPEAADDRPDDITGSDGEEPDSASSSASGSSPGSAADETAGAGTEGSPGPPWCTHETLTASLRTLEPAAGNRYAALVLTNSSDEPCRTQGWPGLQLSAADGEELPTTTVRDHAGTPDRLTLLPGGTAWAQIHWSVVPGSEDPADGCGPAPGKLAVIPPEETEATTTAWDLGEVCGGGRIEVLPLIAGDGPR
ncbi:DUF4232 domain-containing protein [Streptomyces specialis]|uniref:DUF4232 domain-containing protein n=1 Tax=Streptomyces specialis TaxID=498367 RepID=UPI00073E2729|nr:DUF4232 domain-containing protein [Streptomyces specialis]